MAVHLGNETDRSGTTCDPDDLSVAPNLGHRRYVSATEVDAIRRLLDGRVPALAQGTHLKRYRSPSSAFSILLSHFYTFPHFSFISHLFSFCPILSYSLSFSSLLPGTSILLTYFQPLVYVHNDRE